MVVDDSSRDVVTFRLDRLERGQQDLAARSIAPELYARDRAELERRISELETELEQERDARRAAVRALHDRLDKAGTNWRQALFSGVLPALFFIITITVTVLLALRGSGK
ncbi:hypothetical protein GCM10022254_10100 [Actinomadura meridiana]|uniref:Uncharacterized protein n=1 Tax=Actinomadura meridiana TaxID=559626 RepID=A0ABP8BTW3_9ACTN